MRGMADYKLPPKLSEMEGTVVERSQFNFNLHLLLLHLSPEILNFFFQTLNMGILNLQISLLHTLPMTLYFLKTSQNQLALCHLL